MPAPFDKRFKLLTDDDPRAALAAFGGIPLDAEIDVEFLIHFEALSRYRPSVIDHQVDYIRASVSKYRLPCRSYMLLLTEGGVPDRFPRFIDCAYGDYQARIRLRPVRLWRIPAARILRLGCLALYPWIPLMKASPGEIEEAARRLRGAGDRTLMESMFVLGGLRYGKKELFVERLTAMTTEEIFQDTYFYQEAMEKGERKILTRLLLGVCRR